MEKYLVEMEVKDLESIKELAALFFIPREIAVMLEYAVDEFIYACGYEGSAIYKAFNSGRLQSELDLRKGILKLAKSGSSPAQTMAMDLLNKLRVKLLDK